MQQGNGIIDANWIWGGVWIFYAIFYGRYFAHVASRLKPDLKTVQVQGSPERLLRKTSWCYRFAVFMAIPTVLELVRSTDFTSVLISLAPCVFGLWIMRSVWVEVFHSKIPVSQAKATSSRAGARRS